MVFHRIKHGKLVNHACLISRKRLPMSLRSKSDWLLCLLITPLLILSSCTQAHDMVGDHPHTPLPAVVETYLEKYEPGPMPRLFQTTHLYDRNGVELAELFGEGR